MNLGTDGLPGQTGSFGPLRDSNGYRSYRDSDVDRVRRIRTLLAAGLNTAAIARVLPCTIDTDAGLAAACPDLLVELHQERDKISAAITELNSAQHVLDAIIAATHRP
ncbi:MerR family transcriptional regulator [Nocardia otitidiscaviarum]|uniref:MerR family transcriptional regulator n=1 Tax=Nocardia otitidiscaviarum TaxID=1823 RepID=UPI0018946C08|nr:MerR family transcriptional regulator [Nocardia otitidiscaviarum]MBF6240972.1 MerR family transcriptional regulator [Nocardia otitidiscaviarum]